MTTPVPKARIAQDLSAPDLTEAIAGFLADFTTFTNGLQAKLQKQDDRMNKLDRKTMMTARSALATTCGSTQASPRS